MSWADGDASAARALDVWPLDEHNKKLLDAVHPRHWQDPDPKPDDFVYDLIAIGAGAGGLVSAKQSGRRGAKSAMISEHLAGGDCLNVGCVPSKALLHCAKIARDARDAMSEGLLVGADDSSQPPALRVDFAAVMERMRRLRARISPADSHDATQAAGADVYQGRGRFVGPNAVEVNGRTLRFRKAVVATGGRALVPPIAGLAEVPYMTNATLFNLTALPPTMAVLGAGAVALEMAQAFACFGSRVTVFVRGDTPAQRILRREPEAASRAVEAALTKDGVQFVRIQRDLGATRVARSGGGDASRVDVFWRPPAGDGGGDGGEVHASFDALLVATGRTPNVDDLGLDAAGIQRDDGGLIIDDFGATTNPNVYAVGDCASGVPRFTHVAGEMAKLAVQNALFGDAWRVSSLVVPRCVYTSPECASVGLTPDDAAAGGVAIDRYAASLEHNDRAILDGRSADKGCVELYCRAGTDELVGGFVVAPAAGEIISEVTLALQARVGLARVARVIHPYPTTAEGVMGCGLGYIRKHWTTLDGPAADGAAAGEPKGKRTRRN